MSSLAREVQDRTIGRLQEAVHDLNECIATCQSLGLVVDVIPDQREAHKRSKQRVGVSISGLDK